jgi:hypothetical protein
MKTAAFCLDTNRPQSVVPPSLGLLSYADDVYMGGKPTCVVHALTASPGIYETVSLLLGRGPKRTELVLPQGCNLDDLLLPRDSLGAPVPDIV